MMNPVEAPVSVTSVKRVVHATDLTEGCASALAWSIRFAIVNNAEIVLLHVVPPPTPIFEAESAAICEAKLKLSLLLGAVKRHNVRARGFVLRGTTSIDRQILRAASLGHSDLIVIGGHRRGPLSRMLLGSVAARLVTRSHCPVLVVPEVRSE